jgi:hypothetical protein
MFVCVFVRVCMSSCSEVLKRTDFKEQILSRINTLGRMGFIVGHTKFLKSHGIGRGVLNRAVCMCVCVCVVRMYLCMYVCT